MYWREGKLKNLSNGWKILLGSLRFLTGAIIALLLLNPFIKTIKEEIKKPIIVYAQDNSKSVALGEKEALDGFLEAKNASLEQLKADYELINLRFGDEIKLSAVDSFESQTTNISQALNFISDNYSDQNLGAVILATDGLYNEGINPIYQNASLKAPIYSIPLGDSTVRKDVLIKNVFNNQIAYLGDKFDIQVDIQADDAIGQNVSATLSEIIDGKASKISSQNVRIDKNQFFKTITFNHTANAPGNRQYRVSLSRVTGEISTRNNTKNIFIEVLDSRQNFLILANGPNPDITALKKILETNKNYELDIAYASDANINIRSYDFVILHNLPSKDYPISTILQGISQNKKPALYITGSTTDINAFNEAQDVLKINTRGNSLNQSQAYLDNAFSNFTISDQARAIIGRVPALTTHFGAHTASADAKIILKQNIKDIETNEALMLVQDRSNVKTGVIAGEGIWRWRLFNYLQEKNHEAADEIILKLVQYLSTKEDKRKFRTTIAKNNFKETEAVRIDALLYNSNYELVNDPEVTAVIKQGSKDYNYGFSRNGNGYTLDLGRLSPGKYNYIASTNYEGKTLTSKGEFTVQNIELEQYELTAKHGLLYNLANRSGGAVVPKNELDGLSELIQSNQSIKPVAYYSNQTKPVINFKWIWGLLIFLLALEWFIRRFNGSY